MFPYQISHPEYTGRLCKIVKEELRQSKKKGDNDRIRQWNISEKICTNIVHKRDALDVQMFSVERILKKFYDIVSFDILCTET